MLLGAAQAILALVKTTSAHLRPTPWKNSIEERSTIIIFRMQPDRLRERGLFRRTVSVIMLALLSTSMSVLAFDIRPVRATGTIYIRSDGSISPSTAPIKRDGQKYTLTQDVKSDWDGLVVERDYVLVDGEGHRLVGSRSSEIGELEGVSLAGSFITIKNLEITGFHMGVFSNSGKNNNITENIITNNTWGVGLWPSSNCTISNNQISENLHHGIELLESAKFNIISDNNITGNGQMGIRISSNSADNRICGNNITDNVGAGIFLDYSHRTVVYDNNVSDSGGIGIYLFSSSNNRIYHNNLAGNPTQAEAGPPGYTNVWDDGYPSGGNSWNDYAGTDFFSGAAQNETGRDGIGDTPYVISDGNVDRYPIVPSANSYVPKVLALPAYSRVSVLWTYRVGISIEPVQNIWSLNITIHFNSEVARALEVTDRGFLNQPCITSSTIDNHGGIVNFESSEVEPADPKTTDILPSGLCLLIFEASKLGKNYINLEAEFHDKNGNLIPTIVQNATIGQEIPSEYVLAPSFNDYSPSGMPDFDQTQQNWNGFCAPTSTANALWWIDSRCEALWNCLSWPPPQQNDTCALVASYNSSLWDDHDAQNVPFLVEELAFLMDTNGLRTGLSHSGCYDFEAGLAQYLQSHGVNPVGDTDGNGLVDENDKTIVQDAMGSTPGSAKWDLSADLNQDNRTDDSDLSLVEAHMGQRGMISIAPIHPRNFEDIAELFRRGDAVLLFLYLFLNEEYFGGHVVTLAGIYSDTHEVIVHDPHADAFENNRTLGSTTSPHAHASGEQGRTLHNDPSYVSNDAYVVENDSTGCFLSGYTGTYIDDYTGRVISAPPAKQLITGYTISYVPSDEHDIALAQIQPSQATIGKGSFTNINVTIINQGKNAETCSITIQANTTTIAVANDLTLESQTIKTITLSCDTRNLTVGKYTIGSTASIANGETDTSDNTLVDGHLTVIAAAVGDINGDAIVDIYDAILLANALNSKPGDPHWNIAADINNDDAADIYDAILLANNYGKTA